MPLLAANKSCQRDPKIQVGVCAQTRSILFFLLQSYLATSLTKAQKPSTTKLVGTPRRRQLQRLHPPARHDCFAKIVEHIGEISTIPYFWSGDHFLAQYEGFPFCHLWSDKLPKFLLFTLISYILGTKRPIL